MDRAVDAKARLEALHQPVPRPTRKALAENQKEQASRQGPTMMSTMMSGLEKHPDVSQAAHHGEPTMVDPEPLTATGVVRDLAAAASGGADANGKLTATTVNGKVAPNQEAPRSDNPTPAGDIVAPPTQEAATPSVPSAANELKPSAADANELKPNVEPEPNALPPLQQSNQLETSNPSGASSSVSQQKEEMADISSSKKRKKKGLARLKPF